MIDFNAKLGHFPYRPVEGLEALLRAMDRHGVEMALVSSLQAVFYLNPQDGNDELAAALAPHRDRFLLSAVLRPNFTGWQDDLLRCAEDYGARAVLLYPQYHRYELRRRRPASWSRSPTNWAFLYACNAGSKTAAAVLPREPAGGWTRWRRSSAWPGSRSWPGTRFGEPDMLGDPAPKLLFRHLELREHARS